MIETHMHASATMNVYLLEYVGGEIKVTMHNFIQCIYRALSITYSSFFFFFFFLMKVCIYANYTGRYRTHNSLGS